MSEENKALVRRFVEEVQSQHNLDILPEIFDPNFVNHSGPGGMPPPQEIEGGSSSLCC